MTSAKMNVVLNAKIPISVRMKVFTTRTVTFGLGKMIHARIVAAQMEPSTVLKKIAHLFNAKAYVKIF